LNASSIDVQMEKKGIILYKEVNETPEYLSYWGLRNIAVAKANYLRRHHNIVPGKIILIHFQNHRENIVWFWAAILAKCVPAMSTPIVKSSEGRMSHLAHLHQLLLDPLVVTSQDLLDSDFAGNKLLHIVSVPETEIFKFKEASTTFATADHQTSLNVLEHDQHDGNESTNDNYSLKYQTTNGSGRRSTTSLQGVAVLMLTSGSTGSAKAVSLTHEQIMTACKGKLLHLPLPKDATILNWVGLDHVGS
jgi:acyl-CoA synthetase (AMP-forming)/AMP-acid ligase II